MNATWLVTSREFTERLRSRAFLISNGAILALIVLALALPMLFGDDEPTRLGVVGDDAAAVGAFAVAQQDAFDTKLELCGPAAECVSERRGAAHEAERRARRRAYALLGGVSAAAAVIVDEDLS